MSSDKVFNPGNHADGSLDLTSIAGDGDWSYLRAHLDHPDFLSNQSPEIFSSHRISGLGGRLAAWLMHRRRSADLARSRLVLLARLAVGPRQTVTLIEADGVQVLVGTSAEGSPTFLPLHQASPSPWIQAAGSKQEVETSAAEIWEGSLARESSAAPIAGDGSAQLGYGKAGFDQVGWNTGSRMRRGLQIRRPVQIGRVSW